MPEKGLYIQLFSIHGLIRGEKPELGHNADTGGQTKYVLELAKALGKNEMVRKVDLFTRLIHDKTLSSDYSQPIESVDKKVRIVRIQCGGRKYIRKELLWDHLDEFVDKTLKFVKDEDDLPDVVHGHYADAGYVAKELANFWGIPFVFTGHSLGRVKKSDLEASGISETEMNKKFHIDHRIAVEERILGRADLIITSTHQEINKQYGRYDSKEAAHFKVIPPGIDIDHFFPFYDSREDGTTELEKTKQARFFMEKELERFLVNMEKPLILALARPDHRKNIPGLITAYGENKELQAIANLAIFAGIRKDISAMDNNEREVLTELLLLMDKFDLYGKLAIPKRHDVEDEVPALYRIAALSQGIYVNPAFKENFGLTIIEAAASGLPIVATDDGGPRDIVANCKNGILVDVNNPSDIAEAIKSILISPELWKSYSQNGIHGVRDHYVWEAHSQKYLQALSAISSSRESTKETFSSVRPIGKRLAKIDRFFVSDIDDTLLGDDLALAELVKLLKTNRERIGFAVATGRPVDSANKILADKGVPQPDLIISSVGTEIYYSKRLMSDKGWKAHLSMNWHRERIKDVLADLTFLKMQEDIAQREFKISYFMEGSEDYLTQIHQRLTENRLRYNLIYSRDMFLDILPYRASKGKAIRYLSYKWNIPLNKISVAGDSDNDEDMLRGEMLGIVVGNYSPELEKLKGLKHIYFAKNNYAAGIIEGMRHYQFLAGKDD